jgi:RNA-directed DNA polymerase
MPERLRPVPQQRVPSPTGLRLRHAQGWAALIDGPYTLATCPSPFRSNYPFVVTLASDLRRFRCIHDAWGVVHLNGSRSTSPTTRKAIREFADDAPRRIRNITDQLRKGRFTFTPAVGVPIRRPDKDPRPIVVADVRDRVVQRGMLDTIYSVGRVQKAVDTPFSFGGIPKKGVRDAIERASRAIATGVAKYYIKSDISSFFAKLPRITALNSLSALLPDSSLDELLEAGTRTELANYEELGHLIDYFPDDITGVSQGHALSALLGNLLLADFDAAINADGAIGIRYIDDFLILARDRKEAHAAFTRGVEQLTALGLSCYALSDGGKGQEGSAQRKFEFLGCELSRGHICPSSSSCRKLLEKIDEICAASVARMRSGAFRLPYAHPFSILETLRLISNTVSGWAGQYSHCNYAPLAAALDEKIDDRLRSYLGEYRNHRSAADKISARRMLGIRRIGDSITNPIFGD